MKLNLRSFEREESEREPGPKLRLLQEVDQKCQPVNPICDLSEKKKTEKEDSTVYTLNSKESKVYASIVIKTPMSVSLSIT